MSAVNGATRELTNGNFKEFSFLCDEFQFQSPSQRVKAFKASPADRLAPLEEHLLRLQERVQKRDSENAALAEQAVRLEAEATTPTPARLHSDVKKLNNCSDRRHCHVNSFRRSSGSCAGRDFRFWGAEAATVSVHATFTAAEMGMAIH
jgi:hypothetical protein